MTLTDRGMRPAALHPRSSFPRRATVRIETHRSAAGERGEAEFAVEFFFAGHGDDADPPGAVLPESGDQEAQQTTAEAAAGWSFRYSRGEIPFLRRNSREK